MYASKLALILLAAGAQILVAANPAPPSGLLAARQGPIGTLIPYGGRTSDTTEDTKVIRGLLVKVKRQTCPVGDGLCNDGGCCPVGGECCSDGGCCYAGYYCDTVNGVKGCCPNGSVCTSGGGNGGCVDAGYSPCVGDDFCCPTGDVCSRDGAGNPQCSQLGNNNPNPTTTTTTNGGGNPFPVSSSTSSTTIPTPNANPINTKTTSPNSNPTPATTSSTGSSNPTGLPNTSSQSSGAASWKASWGFVGAAPALVLLGMYTW
ncbi:hypothetical protein BJ322DRAFT_546497 [Thelephora terrestris]|uniref:GPI anchored protein n=1 Tax=Thelephora terrestris TaxID=56493 RepID=A0A9P6LA82_9AGAM|nr:hypothetical protein BJ322DRAFT_546497 [Thelephora terrestris]